MKSLNINFKKLSFKPNSLSGYTLALLAGIGMGYRVGLQFISIPYLFAAGLCVYYAFRNEVEKLLTIYPFLVFTEIFIRAYVTVIPYLFMPYLLITLMFILLLKGNAKLFIHSRSFIFLVLFAIFELLNSTRTTNPDNARGLIINTISLAMVSIWSASNTLTAQTMNKILNSVKYASVLLCGIVIARYMKGAVVFQSHSNSESTNGLAPVQLSGYLGFSCIVFFLSLMNNLEQKNIIINLVFISTTAIVMLLSFSRGGLFFVGIISSIYFIFNRGNAKSYTVLLLLIPVGFLTFFYISKVTGGLIEDRYNQEGTSGRDLLVEAGITLFLDNPVAGVGTGNFNTAILKYNIYGESSGAHNEFIRAAAEDGTLGIITYWGFFFILFIEILQRRKTQREYALYFLILFCLITIHNGLKISLQPLLLMFAIATPSIKYVKRTKINAQQTVGYQ